MSNIVNLTPQSIELFVGGADCSALLDTAKIGYASWQPGSGLIVATGDFTLKYSSSFPESMDPKRNKRWATGRPIVLKINGALARPCGTLYIESSSWDTETLSIQATCRLGLANSITAGGLGICFKLDESITLGTAINKLLSAVGISNANLGLVANASAGLLEPINVSEGQSLVGLASQLAISNGYVLYQDRTGIVQIGDITSILTKPTAFNLPDYKLAEYSRANSSELQPGKIVITGSVGEKFFTDTFKASEAYNEGEYGTEHTITNIEIQHQARKIITKSLTTGPIGNMVGELPVEGFNPQATATREKTTTIAYYEASSASVTLQALGDGSPGQPIGSEKCLEPDAARLSKRISKMSEDGLIGLKAWNSIGLATGTLDGSTIIDGTVQTEDTTEAYTYVLPTPKELELHNTIGFSGSTIGQAMASNTGTAGRVTYTKTVLRAQGKEMPLFAKYISEFPISALSLITAEKEISTWELDANLDQWTRETRYFRTGYAFDPEQIQAVASSEGPGVAYKMGRALKLIKSEVVEGESPPDPGGMPPVATIKYTPFTATYELANASTREQSYSVGTYMSTAGDALPVAETYGRWQLGKSNQHIIVLPAHLLAPNVSMVPGLSTCTVYEAFYDTVHHYAIDTPVLIVQSDQAVLSVAGIFLGSQGKHPVSLNQLEAEVGEETPLDPATLQEPEPLSGPESVFNGDLKPNSNGDLTPDGTDLELSELIDGGAFPEISAENPRFSSNSENLGSEGQGGFPEGLSLGGLNFKKPSLPEYPNMNEGTEGFPQSEQELIQLEGGDEAGGGGGGGDPQGGGGFAFPQGTPSVQPLTTFGTPGKTGKAGGAGGGGGLSGAGGSGGGGGGGGGGGYAPLNPTTTIVQYMFWGWYQAFPEFNGIIEGELVLGGALNNQLSYFSQKKFQLNIIL